MSLPSSPPLKNSPVIQRGDDGWPVFALQDSLVAANATLALDGDFGARTEKATMDFQLRQGLEDDGVAGPVTQAKLVVLAAAVVEKGLTRMPSGLLRGMALSESGLSLACVNWSVPKGVDCGPVQYRVYGPPYTQAKLKEAFSTRSLKDAAQDFLGRRDAFLTKAWVKAQADPYAAAGKCAAFAHNWPTAGGADYYAEYGHVSNPGGACSWLPRDRNGLLYIRFPDGVLVQTRQEWAEFYAIGGKHGAGKVTRFVTAWK